MRSPRPRRAGTSAKRRFERAATAWRRRVARASSISLTGGCIACLIAASHVEGNLKTMFGILAGALWMTVLVIRDLVPAHIEAWRRGWEGERRTGRALSRLDSSQWTIVHDIELEHRNIDHVAAGPSGIFLLDTKWWTGRAVIDDTGTITITFPDDPDERHTKRLGPRMRAAAADLHDRLLAHSGHAVWVQAVVVLWTPFAQRDVVIDNVAYVHGSHLKAWLERQPARAHGTHRAHLDAIQAIERSAREPMPVE